VNDEVPYAYTEIVTGTKAKDAQGERALFDPETTRTVALVVGGVHVVEDRARRVDYLAHRQADDARATGSRVAYKDVGVSAFVAEESGRGWGVDGDAVYREGAGSTPEGVALRGFPGRKGLIQASVAHGRDQILP